MPTMRAAISISAGKPSDATDPWHMPHKPPEVSPEPLENESWRNGSENWHAESSDVPCNVLHPIASESVHAATTIEELRFGAADSQNVSREQFLASQWDSLPLIRPTSETYVAEAPGGVWEGPSCTPTPR